MLSGFSVDALSIPELLDAIGLFATHLSSPFLLLHPFRHRFGEACPTGILSAASRAEMADVEQMKKIIPLSTCEIPFGQNVCELMCLVSMHRI